MNRIVLIGRLVRNPEIRYTASDKEVASFTLAVDRRFKNAQGEKGADFINIVAWGQLGKLCTNYLDKGKLVAVEGRLQIRNYEDKEGNKRLAAEVIADNVQFLSPKVENGAASSNTNPGVELPFSPIKTGSLRMDENMPF